MSPYLQELLYSQSPHYRLPVHGILGIDTHEVAVLLCAPIHFYRYHLIFHFRPNFISDHLREDRDLLRDSFRGNGKPATKGKQRSVVRLNIHRPKVGQGNFLARIFFSLGVCQISENRSSN